MLRPIVRLLSVSIIVVALAGVACSGDADDDSPVSVGGDEDAGQDAGEGEDGEDSDADDGDYPCADVDCSDVGGECTKGRCDPATGECEEVDVADGTSCGEDNACISDGACFEGECQGEEPDCSELDEGGCVQGVCDPDTGECVQEDVAEGTTCHEDRPCFDTGECSEGMCEDSEFTCPEPTGVFFSDAQQTRFAGTANGGDEQFDDQCPDDQILTGFEATSNEEDSPLRSLGAECSEVSWSASDPLAVELNEGESLPHRGNESDHEWEGHCPDGHAVVGVEGYDGLLVDQLEFQCAALEVEETDEGLELVLEDDIEYADPLGADGGSEFDPIECGDDQVATTAHIRPGNDLDGFAMTCEQIDFEVE